MTTLPVVYIALTIILTSISQLLQKQAARDMSDGGNKAAILSNTNFVMSGVFLGASLITWLYVLKNFDVSFAYPLLSLNYVVVLLLASLCFGEKIPRRRWIGVLSIVAGVTVLTMGSQS